MHLRPLVPTDTPAIRVLAAEAEREGFRFVTRLLTDLEAGRVDLKAPGTCFLVAVEHEQVVALGGVTPDPYITARETGRVRHLYVRADARRRGVGRMLVIALEDWARTVYTQLRLRTDTGAAVRFYEALGYESVSETAATHTRRLR